MATRDRSKLALLSLLREGRRAFADVRAEYERLRGSSGPGAWEPLDLLVERLIAEKLIDYETAHDSAQSPPPITGLWLRPRGKAALEELEEHRDLPAGGAGSLPPP